jgi:hypothetical protein
MGLGDIISKVLVEFKGDTSDLKAKLKDLSGVEKERTKALVDDIEKQNKGYESAIGKLGQVGLALDTLGKVYDAAKDSMKVYGETLRLETATAGININKLSESFGGLISQHDLMTFAAQTNTGVLKLNQGQMETLGQAALALKNRGFDLEESLKKLTDAAVKGKVEGLDDLGLSIKAGASNAETLKNMMTELNKVIKETGTATDNEADSVQRLSVQWDNASRSIKGYVAEAILAASVDISPESLKKMLGANATKKFTGYFADDETLQVNHQIAIGARRGIQQVKDMSVIEMDGTDLSGDKAARAKTRGDAAKKRAEMLAKLANEWEKKVTDELVGKIEGDIRGNAGPGMGLADYSASMGGIDIGNPSTGEMPAWMKEEKDKKKQLKQQRMDALFGPLRKSICTPRHSPSSVRRSTRSLILLAQATKRSSLARALHRRPSRRSSPTT